jgi:hypothetical protein
VDGYRSADWATFRREVLRLDGNACTQCGKRGVDGVKLHVHHKQYLPGHKPWEYPHDLCATLCSGCHAAEHGIIPPRFGWSLDGYDDLGDLSGECENCGTPHRHSFLVTHPKWRAMEVGTDCCDNLTCTQAASNHVESLLRYQARRKTFVSSPRWRPGYPNGEVGRWHKGFNVSVVPNGAIFRLRISNTLGKKTFESESDAKAAAFDAIESGAVDAWASKPRKPHWLR